jgi:predicted RNA-binding protein (virulence factor B family)
LQGRLDIGEKSSPEEIEHILGPGVSKSNFKKALGMLYKEQVIQRPGKHDVELL